MICALAVLAAAPAFAADHPPCRAHDNGAALDFWLGDWRVTSIDGKTLFGENHMRLDLDGCAVHEDRTTATGGDDRQLIEISVDDGQPWRATFDLRYSRFTADTV